MSDQNSRHHITGVKQESQLSIVLVVRLATKTRTYQQTDTMNRYENMKYSTVLFITENQCRKIRLLVLSQLKNFLTWSI